MTADDGRPERADQSGREAAGGDVPADTGGEQKPKTLGDGESERLLRAFVNAAPVGFLQCDADLRITDANPIILHNLGVASLHDLIGKPLADIAPNAAREGRIAAYRQVIATGEAITIDDAISGGAVADRHYRIHAFRVDDGIGFVTYDVTGEIAAREAHRESAANFQAVFEESPLGIGVVDPSGKVLFSNAALTAMMGYTREEWRGLSFEQITHPEDLARERQLHQELLEGKRESYHIEKRNLHKEGYDVWLAVHARPIRDAQGNVLRIVAIGEDITERKRFEETLQENEARFRGIFDNSPDVVAVTDTAGIIQEINRVSPGYEKHAVVGLNFKDFLDASQKELFDAALRRAGETDQQASYEVSIEDPSGQVLSWFNRLSPIKQGGELTGYVHNCTDVTARKKAERELQTSNAFLKSIHECSEIGVFVLDVVGPGEYRYVGISPVHEKLVQMKNEEIVGKTPDDLVDHLGAETVDHVKRLYDECVEKKQPVVSEFRTSIEGKADWWLSRMTPLMDDEGAVHRLIGTRIIISERKRVEEALRESEERFRSYIDHAPDGILVFDGEGDYLDVNAAATWITGYSRDEMLSMNLGDLIPQDSKELGSAHFARLVETGHASGDLPFVHKDGSRRHLSVNAVRLGDDRFLGFAEDITETRRLQELEARAERLELAGTIAGQVAHDFNNLLGPMVAYPEMIREALPPEHRARAFLDDIEDAARKMANINQDLLTMSRRGHYSQDVLDLNRIVLQVAKEAASQGGTLLCDTELCEDLMLIRGGGAQMHRLLVNLLNNAIDATQGVGRILLKTENHYVDEQEVRYSRVPVGEYVKLTVSDTGCGIQDDIIQKIFDPFFTTKSTDKKRGSGLGLSVVDAVLKDHGGFLDLSSEVGCGTSFYIYLPVTREEVAEALDAAPSGGTETVLVVDDDEVQRCVCRQLLERLGYTVHVVESGERAVEFLAEEPQDLLILDMIMPPGIDGAETYRRIRERHPGQKAIIVSGYSETDRVREAQGLGAGAYVKKPLTRSVLAVAVRAELDRRTQDRGCPE